MIKYRHVCLNKKILTIIAIIVVSILATAYFLPGYKGTVTKIANTTTSFNQTTMLERGNMAMGFNQTMIHHHFMSTTTGGEIMIMSNNSSDIKTINAIRSHVKEIQYEFSKGNFTKPFYIHAQIVPGTDVMAAKKDFINYSIKEIDGGSILVLTTNDTQLLTAIQQFMNFQFSQHIGH